MSEDITLIAKMHSTVIISARQRLIRFLKRETPVVPSPITAFWGRYVLTVGVLMPSPPRGRAACSRPLDRGAGATPFRLVWPVFPRSKRDQKVRPPARCRRLRRVVSAPHHGRPRPLFGPADLAKSLAQ